MHKTDANCGLLTAQTLDALDNRVLELLLASVQQNNINASIKCAIKELGIRFTPLLR
jgi:hypothetical protein